MAYKVVDLFAGAGGLSLGFMQTGKFEIVAAAENNPGARKTYKRNHKLTRLYPDVRTIDYRELEESCGKIDVVIGGPPCQGFSNANRQHTTIISMNNRLVKEYVRAVRELEPEAFVMENVAMLKSKFSFIAFRSSQLINCRFIPHPLLWFQSHHYLFICQGDRLAFISCVRLSPIFKPLISLFMRRNF